MQFWNVTPHGNRITLYLFNKKRLVSGASMLLTDQTFVTSKKSQKYFCVK